MKIMKLAVRIMASVTGALMLVTLLGAVVATPINAHGGDFSKQNAELIYIDVHNHLNNAKLSPGVCTFNPGVAAALVAMESVGIQKSLIMPTPFPNTSFPGQFECGDYFFGMYFEEHYAEIANENPEYFAYIGGGATLTPMTQSVDPDDVTEDILALFEDTAIEILRIGAIGFGEMVAEHVSRRPGHPYMSVRPDHPLLLLLSDIAARNNDVPIDIHMEAVFSDMKIPPELDSPINPDYLFENITAFERLLDHNPKVPIIWSHAGWDNTGQRTVERMHRLLRDHNNLYMSFKLDPTSLPGDPNRIIGADGKIDPEWEHLIHLFPSRFLIGLDSKYPQLPDQRFERCRALLNQLPPGLARKVAYENADRLYNLTGTEKSK